MVAIITNENAVWKQFFVEVKNNFGNVEYGLPESDSKDAITVCINEKIQIDFHLTFRYLFIACKDCELKLKIYDNFKSRFPVCGEPNNAGFAINNIDSYFLGCSRSDKFSVYQNLTKNKNEVIERMHEFISEIQEI